MIVKIQLFPKAQANTFAQAAVMILHESAFAAQYVFGTTITLHAP